MHGQLGGRTIVKHTMHTIRFKRAPTEAWRHIRLALRLGRAGRSRHGVGVRWPNGFLHESSGRDDYHTTLPVHTWRPGVPLAEQVLPCTICTMLSQFRVAAAAVSAPRPYDNGAEAHLESDCAEAAQHHKLADVDTDSQGARQDQQEDGLQKVKVTQEEMGAQQDWAGSTHTTIGVACERADALVRLWAIACVARG